MDRAGAGNLVEYGIQTEGSQLRAHVCPVARRVYVYPTECGVAAIETGGHMEVDGYQAGVEGRTAQGYLVPPFAIARCVALAVNERVWERLAFAEGDSLVEKGRKAARLVAAMVREGLFPLPAAAEEVAEEALQIRGADIVVRGAWGEEGVVIQVKCDYEGGEKALGGSGYLFLQVRERNPFRSH
jgi:hypothetical protein